MIAPASGAAPAIWFPRAGKLQFTTYGLSGTTPFTHDDPDATAADGGASAPTIPGASATVSAAVATPAIITRRAFGLQACIAKLPSLTRIFTSDVTRVDVFN